ncbi:MAG: carboxymuconolactone decarboxylase family protein [Spirochaetia bacterium]
MTISTKKIILLGCFIALTTVVLANIKNIQRLKTPSISVRQQSLAKVAAATALGKRDITNDILIESLDTGLTINEIKEVMIQMYAYTGFPRSLNALQALRTVLQQRQSVGIEDAQGPENGTPIETTVNKWDYGHAVIAQLRGHEAPPAMIEFAPTIETFLREHLFTDIFSRDVLSYHDREIATVAALSVLENVESQLNSHINIIKNLGFTDSQIDNIQSFARSLLRFEPTFGKGETNPHSAYFTGQTYLNWITPSDSHFNMPIANVTFEPGARTYWHKHSGGQILLVTDGEGRYQARGEALRSLHKGDTVHIDADVEHWHGAAPGSWFSHVALSPHSPENQVTWLEEVARSVR